MEQSTRWFVRWRRSGGLTRPRTCTYALFLEPLEDRTLLAAGTQAIMFGPQLPGAAQQSLPAPYAPGQADDDNSAETAAANQGSATPTPSTNPVVGPVQVNQTSGSTRSLGAAPATSEYSTPTYQDAQAAYPTHSTAYGDNAYPNAAATDSYEYQDAKVVPGVKAPPSAQAQPPLPGAPTAPLPAAGAPETPAPTAAHGAPAVAKVAAAPAPQNHEAAGAAVWFNGPAQRLSEVDNAADRLFDELGASAASSAGASPAHQTANLLGTVLAGELDHLQRAVDTFMARLETFAGELASDESRKLLGWLAAAAIATGTLEFARRQMHRRAQTSSGDTADGRWAPYPVLALLPPEDQP